MIKKPNEPDKGVSSFSGTSPSDHQKADLSFPLIAYGNISYKESLPTAYVKLVAQCYCNCIACTINNVAESGSVPNVRIVGGYNPLEGSEVYKNMQNSLDACNMYRIGFMPHVSGQLPTPVPGSEIKNECDYIANIMNEFGKSTGIAGWLVMEEPGAETFPTLSEYRDTFAVRVNGPLVVRLSPITATCTQLGVAELDEPNEPYYQIYIEEFLRAFAPDVWAGNAPAFNPLKGSLTLLPDYFRSLTLFNYLSVMTGKPFYATVNTSVVFLSRPVYPLPVPYTKGAVNFQISCSLAFGAKGILYDKMVARKINDIRFPIAAYAPIVVSGESYTNDNSLYTCVQEANKNINMFKHIFLSCNSLDVRYAPYVENETPYGDLPALDGTFPFVSAVTIDGETESGTLHVLLSRLRSSAGEWLMVVNLDYQYAQTVSLTFKESMQSVGTTPIIRYAAGTTSAFKIDPGCYILLGAASNR